MDDVNRTKRDETDNRDETDTKDDKISTKRDATNKDDVTSTKGDVTSTKDDVPSTKRDETHTKKDVTSTKKEATDTTDDVTCNKKQDTDRKDDATITKKDATDTNDNVTSTKEVADDSKDDVTGTKKDATNAKDDVTGTKTVASNTEDDVTGSKQDATDTKDDVTGAMKDASDTKDDVTGTKKDASGTKDDVTGTKRDSTNAKDDVNGTKRDGTNAKDDVTGTKKDASDTKDDVTGNKKDATNAKNDVTEDDVTGAKTDASDTKGDVTGTKKDTTDTNFDVSGAMKDASDTKDDVTGTKKDALDTKDDVTGTKKDATDTEDDVNGTKRDGTNTKDDVTSTKGDATDNKDDVTSTKKDATDTGDDVTSTHRDGNNTNDYVTGTKKDATNTKDDVTSTKKDNTKDDVTGVKKDFSSSKNKVTSNKEVLSDITIYTRIRKDVSDLKKGVPRQEDVENNEEKAYMEMKSKLQDDLISLYKHEHRSISLSPVLDEDQPLLKFYGMPNILSVKVTRSRDGDRQEKKLVKSLRDMFYKENRLCSNIYLSADAGYGKTAFCKRLALAWCQAKKPDESERYFFSKDEITAMGGFSFVFVVLLRDSSCECEIDKLILNQILSKLSDEYSLQDLRKILREETCLVVLDGLDEWTHPLNSCRNRESNIPHQRVRENVAVLTTTRPYKISLIGLTSSQIDHKLELEGLSNDLAEKLTRSMISHLYKEENKEKIEKYVTEFNMSVQESHTSGLTAIPFILINLIFLWYYKLRIGKSIAYLYSSFIELLLSRSRAGITLPKTETVQCNIPPCFNEKELCKQFYTLLTALGKLAFYTLVSEKKENTLVFDGCVAEKYLNKEVLFFFHETGIITQSKVLGVSLQQRTKLSFAHRTLQEFLAALYMNSAPDRMSVQDEMMSKCKCVKDILDLSKVLMFAVGIGWECSFINVLREIINRDVITQEFRSSLQHDHFHPLKDIQDVYISCCKEIPRESESNLCLQDVFYVDESCKQEEYLENLKRLTRYKQNIRSLYMSNVPYIFPLSNIENVEKIHYEGKYSDEVISFLSNSSVKCLSLSCSPRGLCSRSLFDKEKIQLEAINISGIDMCHSELSLLLDYVSQSDCLREVELGRLDCTDHVTSRCPGHNLDLSRSLSLRKLTLYWLNLSEVKINIASLEDCNLQDLHNRDLILRFLNLEDNKLETLSCERLKSSAAIDAVLDTLRWSRHITKVKLADISLEKRTVTLSSTCVNIEIDNCGRHFKLLVDSVHDLR